MRVVVAPDSFGGTLSAVEAAAAMAAGWHDVAPADDIDAVPMSDGGPGFVDVLHAGLGGAVRTTIVPGPLGAEVAARWLRVDGTVYVEAAQACGLHLVTPSDATVRRAGTAGLGALLAVAAAGARQVVVGVGGTATNDGGQGLVAALPGGLRWPYAGELVVATDVDNPLLGPNGAAAVYGPQKGADRATVLDLDDALRRWADEVEAEVGRPGLRDEPGAGAGGGLGFALVALGGRRISGAGLVAAAVGLAERVADADLVVTGEGSLDAQSVRGKVVSAVANAAREAGVPCLAVAGRAPIGRRDAAAAGIDDIATVEAALGSTAAALHAGAAGVSTAAAVLARRWARRR